MVSKMAAGRGRSGIVPYQSNAGFYIAAACDAFVIGCRAEFLDPRLFDPTPHLQFAELQNGVDRADVSIFDGSLAEDFDDGDGDDRVAGLPCGLFHLVLCSAQTQGYVDLFDHHPVLDQLFDAHFPVESDFRL